MKQGWDYTTFGNVMKPAKSERCGNRTDLPILSITMRQGVILQSERFKKVIASVDTKDYKIIKNGQLVIAFPIDEGLIYTQDVADEGIMSPAYNVWDVDYSRLNRKFLNVYFHSPWAMNYYKSKLRGTTLRRRMIPKEDLLNMPIPVPPLSIQERIVEELDCLSGIIDKKKQQLKELDALAQSIFYTMFGDPITNDKGWEVIPLKAAAVLKAGKAIKANELSDTRDNELYPCFGGNGIRGYISKKSHSGQHPIIGRQGALCGNVVFAQGEFYATEHAIVCNKIINDIIPLWMYYALRFNNLNRFAQGVAQPGISVSIINEMPLILPPLPLQQEFAKKVEAIEKQKELIRRSIGEVETLLASRMQEYFE